MIWSRACSGTISEIDKIKGNNLAENYPAHLKATTSKYLVVKTILLDDRYDYYLAVNRKTEDVLVNKLQTSLDRIKQNGAYGHLWKKYSE